ncbi:MAG: DUF6531 domain-containing protein, partial [Solirubrobacterales bacterium]
MVLTVVVAVVVGVWAVLGGFGAGGGHGDFGASAETADSAKRLAPPTAKSIARTRRAAKRWAKKLEAVETKRKRSLATPKAVSRRLNSRTKYMSLKSTEAIKVARETQPGIAVEPAWNPPALQRGEEIVSYESATQARIVKNGKGDPRDRETMLVQSAGTPIAAPGKGGSLVAIDTALQQSAGGWVPRRTSVATRLPKSLKDPVSIGPDESPDAIQVVLSDGDTSGMVLSGSKVFYANTSTDTDTIVEPTPLGASFSWLVRSPRSPARQSLRFGPSSGTKVRLRETGDAEIVNAGKVIAEISAPVAFDAQGRSVATKFVESGGGVDVEIDHVGEPLAYPIAVDPVINWYGNAGVQATNADGWSWMTDYWSVGASNPSRIVGFRNISASGYPMLNLETRGSSGWAYGGWSFDPVRNSTVVRADFANVRKLHSGIHMSLGLTQAGGGWQPGQWAGMFVNGDLGPNANSQFGNPAGYTMPSNGTTVTACSQGGASCTWGGPSGNGVYFEIVADGGTEAYQHADFLGGYFYLSDNENPTVTAISGMPPSSWRNASTISPYVAVEDQGLGVGSSPYGAAIEIGVDGVYSSANTAGPACDGGPSWYCPDAWGTTKPVYNLRGERNVSIRSRDIIGHMSATTNYTVRNDDKPPVVALSGRFGAFALDSTVQTGAARTMVNNTPFVVTVTDGSTSANQNRQSGVENLTTQFFRADENEKINLADPVTGTARAASNNSVPSCNAAADPSKNSCPLKLADTFNAPSLAAGTYFLRVVAKDYAGLTTERAFKVAVGIAEIASVTEGQASSRYVPLQIKQNKLDTGGAIPAGSSGTGRLIWREIRNGAWVEVNTACVQLESSGATLSATGGWPVALNAQQINGVNYRTSARWVVDLDCLRRQDGTRLPDGEVFFAARVDGAAPEAQRGSEDVTVRYDHGGKDTNDDTADLGPGSVDLVTGNLSISSTDVSISGFKSPLTVSRTYNSRYGAFDNDGLNSVFGPGWRSGQPVESSGSDYVSLIDNADVGLPEEERLPFVEVTDSSASVMAFELQEASGKYISEVGLESLELAREGDPAVPTRTLRFTLTDRDSGTVTTFERPDASATTGAFVPVSVAELGTPDSTKLTYTFSGGKAYLSTAIAASGSVTCSATWSGLARGCQGLKYNYTDFALPDRPGLFKRLTSVTLRKYAPDLTAGNGISCNNDTNMCEIPVGQYEYDSLSRLTEAWDPRVTPALKTTYTYESIATNSLASVKPAGEQPFTIAYRKLEEDTGFGRVDKVSRSNLAGGTADWSLRYYVPTSGADAPFDFSQAKTSEWGQENGPFMATAVFPPDQQPAGYPATASEYPKASISYLDPLGREVNAREPGGRINVTEYSKYGEVIRNLSAENRARAMAKPTASARLEYAQRWDTQNTYTDVPGSLDARRHLVRTVGPERLVQMEDRTQKLARSITQTCYDERSPLTSGDCKDKVGPDGVSSHEGSAITTDPTTEPLDLPTTTRSSALVDSGIDQVGRATGGTISDTRTTTVTYGATEKEWKLRIPRETITDPGTGKLNIKRRVTLNSDGLEVERFQPRSQASNEPSTTKTIYYTAGANPDHS